jgi:hypothetical protein
MGLKLQRHSWIFIAIGALALLFRLAPLLRPGSDWLSISRQAHQYIALAQGLRFGCGFARLVNGICLEPEQLRTPGYPVLLSLIPTIRYIVVVQAFIGTATCLMIGQFTRRRWGLAAGALAAAFLAIDLPSIVVCGAILSECLFQAVIAACVIVELHPVPKYANCRRAVAQAVLAGTLLGIAILIRPIASLLSPMMAIPWATSPQGTWRRRVVLATMAVMIPSLITFGWMVRNRTETGIWTLSGIGLYNLYYFRAGGVLWYRTGHDFRRIQVQLAKDVGLAAPQEFISPKTHRLMTQRALEIFRSDPAATLIMTARSLLYITVVPDRLYLNRILATRGGGTRNVAASAEVSMKITEMMRSPLLTGLVIIQLPLLGLIWLGALMSLRKLRERTFHDQIELGFIFLIALTLLLLAAGPEASARLRTPAMPFLSILAGVGWFGKSRSMEIEN